ncbi:MAG: MATE family efflux transporter [Clostridia bacterium]|nr:MATE family efflux transporter [Clostridia bacterium]
MERKRFQADPLHGSIVKNMIIFAIPIMAVTLLYSLFSSIDTMVVGKFGHENAMSAIGVSQSVIWTIIAIVSSLGSGVSMVFGRLYGEKKHDEIHRLLQALPLSVGFLGMVLAVIAIIAAPVVLRLVNCPDTIYEDSLIYFRLSFLCVPFMVTFTFFAAAVEAKGDSFTPFIFQVISQVCNVILNLFFVIVLDLNVLGVGIATVISDILSFTLMVIHLVRQNDELKLKIKELVFFKGTREIFEKGIPSSLQGFALNITAVVITAFINSFDEVVISGNTVAGAIEGLMMVGFAGFESASVVFIAQNLGAKNIERVKKCFGVTMIFVVVISEALRALALIFARPLTGLFTDDPMIQEIAIHRMEFLCLTYCLCGTMNSISGCIRGLQDSKTPLIISIIGSVFFRLGWLLTVSRSLGTIESIYIAFPLTWALCTVLGFTAFIILFRKRKNEIEIKEEI